MLLYSKVEFHNNFSNLQFHSGEKISPIEVDAVLISHPEVAQAVAFGVPDDKYGEEVSAQSDSKCIIITNFYS